MGPGPELAKGRGKRFTESSRELHGKGVNASAVNPVMFLLLVWLLFYPSGPEKLFPFTGRFTESSRSFTDAGESAISIYLHGDLHGSFTDLHGCLFFETEK